MTLTFEPGGKDQHLVFANATTNGFEMAGTDGVFVPANAELRNNTIVLAAPGLTGPRAIRYAWSDNPPAILFNTAGLPAGPFRKTVD